MIADLEDDNFSFSASPPQRAGEYVTVNHWPQFATTSAFSFVMGWNMTLSEKHCETVASRCDFLGFTVPHLESCSY